MPDKPGPLTRADFEALRKRLDEENTYDNLKRRYLRQNAWYLRFFGLPLLRLVKRDR